MIKKKSFGIYKFVSYTNTYKLVSLRFSSLVKEQLFLVPFPLSSFIVMCIVCIVCSCVY